MDFVSDQLFDGCPFRMLTVVDCLTREALSTVLRVGFRAYQVVELEKEGSRSTSPSALTTPKENSGTALPSSTRG